MFYDKKTFYQRTPLNGPMGCELPAQIRDRLEQRMNSVRAQQDAKSLEAKMRNAQEKTSHNIVDKIQRAQAHNEKVRSIMLLKRNTTAVEQLQNFQPQNEDVPADRLANELQVMKNIVNTQTRKLNFERRMAKAAARK